MAESNVDSEKIAADRNNYYNKWDKFAEESVKQVEQEDEELATQAAAALGLKSDAPLSEAEKIDREKREALKEAKKLWDQKQAAEAAAKAMIGEDHDGEELVVNDVYLKNRRVMHFKGSKNSKYVVPSTLGLRIVKIFIEDCENCTFELGAVTISQHVEISHCENCTVMITAPQSIVQLDLSKNLHLQYSKSIFDHDAHKVYHAGVSESKIHVHNESGDPCHVTVDYDELGATATSERTKEEHQFVTHWVDGALKTEEVFRSKGNMPLTKAEIEEAERLGDGDGLQNQERSAELKKIGGNEAFSEANYAQAAIFYTEAIELAPKNSQLKPLCYSNRAFSHLKLGHLPEALEDADKAIELDPKYCKAHFRKGLALHAMKRYREAAIALTKALDLEPKNQQIKQALGFAQRKAMAP
mmetsp:Transcript_13537/g.25042  ORF Transcript_13537/g.25042 Transcript_13537/m.25042 type:complete len:414 (+) Transcript_13537:69-1310(+)